MNEACCTYELVMSHTSIRHHDAVRAKDWGKDEFVGVVINELCCRYECVTSRARDSETLITKMLRVRAHSNK